MINNDKNSLISIIVPVYNSEKSLKLCLTSLVNQIFSNIEIIIVNDGSTDGSLKICKEFQKKDDRILIINQNNQGRSVARNVGICNASGQYIMFVDSDDYVSNEYCMKAIEILLKYNADIVLFDYYIKKSNSIIEKNTCAKNGILNKEEAMDTVIDASFLPMKIFKKKIFNNVKFPVNKNYEDVFTTYQLVEKAKKIYHLEMPLYYYVQRDNSVTHIKNPRNVSDYFEASFRRFKFLQRYYPHVAVHAQSNLKIISFFYLIYNKNDQFYTEAENIFYSRIKAHNISKKLQMIMWLYHYMPNLTGIIVKNYFN